MRRKANVGFVLMLIALTFGVPAVHAESPEGKGRTADKGAPPQVKAGGPQAHDGAGKSGAQRADPHRAGMGHGHDPLAEHAADDLRRAAIDRDAVRRLVLAHRLTGRSPLPPGIRRNLARGKPLPPGIARQAVPGPVLRGLPHYEGYEWLVCGTDLVLVAIAGAIVADVIFDAFD
jgi:Ni/Co efflux regulator RcnB